MIKLIFYILLLWLIIFIFNYINYKFFKNEKKAENKYYKRKYMTECELNFYNKIKELEKENYKIIPQINLATIIEKDKRGFQAELFRNIDFGIFDKNFEDILLLIELNDSSHKKSKRKKRDIKVRKICKDANIKIITFYTNFSNEKEYVINRIKKEILIEDIKK